jgi:coenzyme F420 hydrogenase subunit beta
MNVKYTTSNNLCLGCGLCEDVCPVSSIRVSIEKGEYRPVVDDSRCLGDKCSKCTKICPGLGVDIDGINRKLHQDSDVKEDKYIGRYIQLYTGHSTDKEIRYHSASGGMITGLLVWLFEKGIIQGAVVTRFSEKDHLTPEPFIARNKEELLSARSSKYCPVSMQGIRKQVR